MKVWASPDYSPPDEDRLLELAAQQAYYELNKGKATFERTQPTTEDIRKWYTAVMECDRLEAEKNKHLSGTQRSQNLWDAFTKAARQENIKYTPAALEERGKIIEEIRRKLQGMREKSGGAKGGGPER